MSRHPQFGIARPIRRAILVAALGVALAALAFPGGSERDGPRIALAVVVHKSFTPDSLTSGMLRRVLSGELTEWDDSRKVVLVQQTPENPAYEETLKLVLHTDPHAYKRHLFQMEFQGKDLPLIKTLNSDETVIKFIGNVPGAIAVVDAAAAANVTSRVKVLRIDGKLPGERGYAFQ